jgi:hypothetical protein
LMFRHDNMLNQLWPNYQVRGHMSPLILRTG